MKNFILFLLAGVLLPAQATDKSKCEQKTVSETIPYGAVEPVFSNQQPYCPRDEYQLKWYVEEEDQYYTASSDGLVWFGASGSSNSSLKIRTVLTFKPMCVLKEVTQ